MPNRPGPILNAQAEYATSFVNTGVPLPGGKLKEDMYQPGESILAIKPVVTARAKRNRRPLPPIEMRDWMTAEETALALGCSVASVHRLRRGIVVGVAALPAVTVGTRKFIFRKATVAYWQDQNENGTA